MHDDHCAIHNANGCVPDVLVQVEDRAPRPHDVPYIMSMDVCHQTHPWDHGEHHHEHPCTPDAHHGFIWWYVHLVQRVYCVPSRASRG